MGRPGTIDYIVLAVIGVIWPLYHWLWYWPRCVRAIRTGVPGARLRTYRNLAAAEWSVTLFVLGMWVVRKRPWSALWLVPVSGRLRLGLGLLFAATFVGWLWTRRRKILAQPKLMARLRKKIAYAEALMPHTNGERRAFWLASATAGICEEILFRGFAIWLIAPSTGLILAIIISSILFGFGHVYLRPLQVPITAMVGLVLAIIVVATGSLWPAIAIHAGLNINNSEISFRMERASVAASGSATSLTN